MALDSVLARYSRRTVTPVTPAVTPDVTPEPAWIGACTPVTAVTPILNDTPPTQFADPEPPAGPALLEAQRLTARLIAAAMRRCDEFGDSQAARAEMRDDCLATPPHLQADLLEHFQAEARLLPAKEVPAQPVRRAVRPEPTANPAAWRELAAAYHEHHFQCPTCKAAGRGVGYGPRCGVGASLWTNYQGIP